MKDTSRIFASFFLCAVIGIELSCTSTTSDSQNKAPANASAPSAPAPAKARTTATGTLTAKPNPIKVCDKTGSGVTTLSWTSNGASAVEIRVGKPDGDLFAKSGPEPGKWTTGKWVGNGMMFYLQDVSGGKPLAPENTIATLVINVTADGCP